MKKFILSWLVILPLAVSGQDLPKSEFTVSAGYLFEGEVYLWYPNFYGSFGETFLLKLDYTGYFSDAVGLGGYVSYGSPWYDGYEEVSMSELGIIFRTRFKAGEQFLLKPALYLGYRTYGSQAGQGLAVDFSAALQYQGAKVRPFFEIGFITQPAGGNDATDITYSPVFQTSIGITL